ncbi:MAG: IPTL-CTERM sorting domain-containing protein [Burkholderiales bacterium]|nr:IPTL-CTERM sorting domain-containing protein [Burkholderiales bacterium]
MTLTARDLTSSAYPDPIINNTTFLNGTNNALSPTSGQAGGTVADGVTPVNPANGIFVARFTLNVPGTVPAGTYTVGPSAVILNITGTTCDDTNSGGASDLSLTDPTPLQIVKSAAPATAVFTISGPVNVTEGGSVGTATVTCTGSLDSNNTPITVPYTLAGHTGNFTVSPGSPLTFNSCPSTLTLTVAPRSEDTTIQGPVSGTITLGTPSAGSLGTPSASTVNVADNDAPPTVSVTASGTCAEPSTNCSFTVTATSNTTPAQTGAGPSVPFTLGGTATNNTDYKLVLGTNCAAAAANSPVATTFGTPTVYTVCVIDDATPEPTETVTFTLTAGTGYTLGTASASVNITDDDGPQTVTISVAPASVAENSGTPLVYTITRSGGSAGQQAAPLTVNLTGSGTAATSRYSTTCGTTITIAGGQTSATCQVTPINNGVVDGSTTAVVTVGSGSNYTVGNPGSATGTITDDDIQITVTPAGAVEGGNVTFTLSCSGPSGVTVSNLAYTLSGVDSGAGAATPASPVSLTCGTPLTITVPTVDDTVIGNGRNVSLTLSGGTASNGGTVVLPAAPSIAPVADNDAPTQIPTMGAAGLAMLALLLAGLAGWMRRRIA